MLQRVVTCVIGVLYVQKKNIIKILFYIQYICIYNHCIKIFITICFVGTSIEDGIHNFIPKIV